GAASYRVTNLCEPARIIAAGSPSAAGVFDPGKENIASALQPQRDAIRRAPFVQSPCIEKSDQHMKLPSHADDFAGRVKRISEGSIWDRFCVIRRLGCRGDEATDFPRGRSAMRAA